MAKRVTLSLTPDQADILGYALNVAKREVQKRADLIFGRNASFDTKRGYLDRIARIEALSWELDAGWRGVRETAEKLADVLAKDNPNFRRGQFMTACGFDADQDVIQAGMWKGSPTFKPEQR